MKNPWEDIKLPAKELNVKRIDPLHPLSLFWSRNQTGDYLLLAADLRIAHGYEAPELEGIRLVVTPSVSGKGLYNCILVLNNDENWEIFHAICTDLVRTTRASDASSAFDRILLRLRKWRAFLIKRKTDAMTDEKARGLIGELLFMERELAPRFGWQDALGLWTGPQGCPQDFSVQNTAVEVKAKLSTSRKEVKISSAEQLESMARRLYLYVVTLGKCSAEDRGALTLNTLVNRIGENFATSVAECERFADLLMAVGYSPDCTACNAWMKPVETVVYEVRDEFPRLTSQTLPRGIIKVVYSISLDSCAEYLGKPEWMSENE